MKGRNRMCDGEETRRITENLRRCAELTDLCLRLRCAVLRQEHSDQEAFRKAMGEVRQAKEHMWRLSHS